MREIKFRAWDTHKKVMYSANELGADQETLSVDGRGFVNVSGDNTGLSQFHTHLLPLEYTGLKDKNGKEIYEGDIVASSDCGYEDIGNYEVKWDIEMARYVLKTVGSEFRWHCGLEDDEVKALNLEVIGNIYSYPELIK